MGVVLSDSLLAAQPVAETWVVNRRRGSTPLPPRRRRRRTIAPPFHCSRATVLVALDGDARAAVACNLLLVTLVADTACRRPGGRALLSARGRVVIPLVGFSGAAVGFLLRGNRVNEPLDALSHLATLVASRLSTSSAAAWAARMFSMSVA